MKLIVNENFQHKGMRRADTILTVDKSMIKSEFEKGYHPVKVRGSKRFISGVLQHCTPANDETADYIEKLTGKKSSVKKEDNEDAAKEILEIRAEFDLMGMAYNNRLGIKKLREALKVARKAYAKPVKETPKTQEIK